MGSCQRQDRSDLCAVQTVGLLKKLKSGSPGRKVRQEKPGKRFLIFPSIEMELDGPSQKSAGVHITGKCLLTQKKSVFSATKKRAVTKKNFMDVALVGKGPN